MSVILFTPALVSIAAVPWIQWGSKRLPNRATRTFYTFYTAGLVFAYGAVVGLFHERTIAVLGDLLQLAPPVVLGFFVLSGPFRDESLREAVLEFAMYATLFLGAYGVVQYLFLPAWDAQWMLDSGMTVIGRPQPGSVRVFSTLNSPGPLAQTLAALILIMSAGPSRRLIPVGPSRSLIRKGPSPSLIRVVSIFVGLLTLGLTQIRSVWVTIVAGALLLVGSRKFRSGRAFAVMLASVLLLVAVGGPIIDQIQQRIEETVGEGLQDGSLTERIRFQASIAPQVLVNIEGRGLGSTGLASEFSHDTEAEQAKAGQIRQQGGRGLAHFDSGVLEILWSLGVVAGGIFLVVATSEVIGGLRLVPNRGAFLAAVSSATAMLLLGLFFTHTLKSAPGAVFWVCLGILGRSGVHFPSKPERIVT